MLEFGVISYCMMIIFFVLNFFIDVGIGVFIYVYILVIFYLVFFMLQILGEIINMDCCGFCFLVVQKLDLMDK